MNNDPQENSEAPVTPPGGIRQCWSKIGSWGSQDCPHLHTFQHCISCSAYANKTINLLGRPATDKYLSFWETQLGSVEEEITGDDQIVALIFRLYSDWFAFPAKHIQEIMEIGGIHELPHKKSDVLLGITNLQGEMGITICLPTILGLEEKSTYVHNQANQRIYERFLVIGPEDDKYVSPVDEVKGLYVLDKREGVTPPVTTSKSKENFTTSLFTVNQELKVSLLDTNKLMDHIDHCLS